MKIVIIIFVPCNVLYASCMCDAILHHNSISNISLFCLNNACGSSMLMLRLINFFNIKRAFILQLHSKQPSQKIVVYSQNSY